MNSPNEVSQAETIELLRTVLKSQYHASLAMLRQAVEKCPEDLWYSTDQLNSYWQIVYHTLFFAHMYLQPNEAAFRPWKNHQRNVQNDDGLTRPPDPSSSLPLLPDPYTKEQVLEYWGVCEAMVDSAVDALDLRSPDSGFSWHKGTKLEHQFVNIRHIQHGAAQLAARLRATRNVGLDWIGTGAVRQPRAG